MHCSSFELGNGSTVIYNGVSNSSKSALLIPAGSLQPNQTYQFKVCMDHKRNQSDQATGYVLVRVEETIQRTIAVG
jgi:hypothetical protein